MPSTSSNDLDSSIQPRDTRFALIEHICRAGVMTRPELSHVTGIPLPTIHRLCSHLKEEGVLVDSGQGGDGRGRPSTLMGVNPRLYAIQVITVADDSITGCSMGINGDILHETSPITSLHKQSEDTIKSIIGLIRDLYSWCDAAGIPRGGIGVSVPGITGKDGSVTAAGELGWTRVPLRSILSSVFDEDIIIENNANTFAFGEYLKGQGKFSNPLVGYIMRRFGVGTGLICNGEILRGNHGAAGELGYALTGLDALNEYHINSGDLEWQMAGIDAQSNDPEIQERLLNLLALSIADLCSIIDPEIIVTDINTSLSNEMLIDGLSNRLVGRIPNVPRIIPTQFGTRASTIGMGELISRRIRRRLFDDER